MQKKISPSVHNLAENSRAHNGEHLMKNGIRHAMGEAFPSIFDGSIGIATCNNVLVFSNKVKPSVRQGLYQTKDFLI